MDDRIARRIRLLRLKAESTTFPAEAESLRAKADELERLHFEPEEQVHSGGRDQAWQRLYEQNLRNIRRPGVRVVVTTTGSSMKVDNCTFGDGGSWVTTSGGSW